MRRACPHMIFTLYTTLLHNLHCNKRKTSGFDSVDLQKGIKNYGSLYLARNDRKVQVGKDQEKAQSEKDSHSKNRGGKKPN